MPYVRPRIDDLYLTLIRAKFPEETNAINTIEGLVMFAIKKALDNKKRGDKQ